MTVRMLEFLSQAATATAAAAATTEMQAWKIWVRQPGGLLTLVPILEDVVVDELCNQVILKYMNLLGKMFDSPGIVSMSRTSRVLLH